MASDATYNAVRAARPTGETIPVQNLVIQRDAFTFTLVSGSLHLLPVVNGHRIGAVFLGDGRYDLRPSTSLEQKNLALVADDPALTVLTDHFSSAVILSTDAIDEIVAKSPPVNGTAAANAVAAMETFLKKERKEFKTNFHIRTTQDLLNAADKAAFIAYVDGQKLAPAVIAVDPLGAESIHLSGSQLGGEESMLYVSGDRGGIWYLAHRANEPRHAERLLADADHYVVDSEIRNSELTGKTTMVLDARESFRLLSVALLPTLRISAVDFARVVEGKEGEWKAAAWIQEDKDEDGDSAVILPEEIKKGERVAIRVTYGGKDALVDAGDGNYFVGARSSWYPNVGSFRDMANFEMSFRIPTSRQVITVGDLVDDRPDGDMHIVRSKTARPVRVAGFNYGKFKKLSSTDKQSGFTVNVYTNPGTPQIIEDINRALEAASAKGAEYGSDPNDPFAGEAYVGERFVKVSTADLAKSAMADGVNTARVASAFFGAVPNRDIAITQQSQWFFGQSWPSLIYLPYVAFLDSSVRNTLGLNDVADFVDKVGIHEFAHQWWGHHVSPATYHDEWISEGLAEFTTGLVVQQSSGWGAYNTFWEKKRRQLLTKEQGALIPNSQAGPIALGWRISTWKDRNAYQPVVYNKGAYVMHMLRMVMSDPANKNADATFSAAMTEFASEYGGKTATTEDLQHVFEKHMVPMLNMTRDGKLDWFFQQWVYGTEIPKLTQNFTVTDAGGGKYHIAGSVTQSGVDPNFAVMMPLYVEFDKGAQVRFGFVPLIGNATQTVNVDLPLPKKPKRVLANAMHDILVSD